MAADLATHPLLYALLLAGGVGLGLPMGAAVVAAGAMFGGAIGLVVGLAINWNLCRHWCRAWIVRRMQRKRRWHWILSMVDARLSWRTVLLLRLALLPMALVSACCALSVTGWRGYSLASTVLVLRFAVLVQAGAQLRSAQRAAFRRDSSADRYRDRSDGSPGLAERCSAAQKAENG